MGSSSFPKDVKECSDAELAGWVREGQSNALDELWRRHSHAGIAMARRFTSTFDPEDLVSEAYVRILSALRNGGGPKTAFRAYLFTTIRNVAVSWSRRNTAQNIERPDEIPAQDTADIVTALDGDATVRAFRTLPERWQTVLWHTEVENTKLSELAEILGIRPNAVAALAYRAREGLRQAWIQAHLRTIDDGSEHQWVVERLAAYLRNRLSRGDHGRVHAHLDLCDQCSLIAQEAKHVAPRLRSVLAPLMLAQLTASGPAVDAAVHSGFSPEVLLSEPSGVIREALGLGWTARTLKMCTILATAGAVMTGSLPPLPTPEFSPRPAAKEPPAVETGITSKPPQANVTPAPAEPPPAEPPPAEPPPAEPPPAGYYDHSPAIVPPLRDVAPSTHDASEEPIYPTPLAASEENEPLVPRMDEVPMPLGQLERHWYEAELPPHIAPVVYDCQFCSAMKRAGMIGHGGTLVFNEVTAAKAATVPLEISYTNGDHLPRQAQIRVNDSETLTFSFPPTANWETPASIIVQLTVQEGGNIIHITNKNDWAPDIDRIRL